MPNAHQWLVNPQAIEVWAHTAPALCSEPKCYLVLSSQVAFPRQAPVLFCSYDDDDEKKTAADAMKDPDDPDKDRGRSTRTPGQTMTRAEIHRAAREAMTYQEAMIPNRYCVICAKRLHPLRRGYAPP